MLPVDFVADDDANGFADFGADDNSDKDEDFVVADDDGDGDNGANATEFERDFPAKFGRVGDRSIGLGI